MALMLSMAESGPGWQVGPVGTGSFTPGEALHNWRRSGCNDTS